MEVFFNIAVIAFLLLIAIELLLIYKELLHRSIRGSSEEDKEVKSASGQTINVNLANPSGINPAGVGMPVILPVGTVQMESTVTPKTAIQKEEREEKEKTATVQEREAPSVYGQRSLRPPPSGNPFAKVCPSCGVENSTYRTECFNCGKPL
ncbi:hypothetical protein [Treponema sp. J25]|uniref:hypothetical protein n=1 Tax=Treponema sp. J25 TaxID=2094121 RepID=UPI00104A709F|nr:hypothetical protein [Treponema sp. J25]TCW61729.1 hypothetical protein C5O22_04915 [Treponema sp. J25]